MFDVQWDRLLRLNATGEDNRMLKMQEEQGELSGAISAYRDNPDSSDHRLHALEETVDVILMTLSIIGDAPRVSGSEIADTFDSAYKVASTQYAKSDRVSLFLRIVELNGLIAEADQKLSGVKSSAYKANGDFDLYTTAAHRATDVFRLLAVAINLAATLEAMEGELQSMYNNKMDKWEAVTTPTPEEDGNDN